MSQRTIVELIDDLDGGNADETITFSLDGIEYEIDLSEQNGAQLRDALSTYTDAARKTGGRRKPATTSKSSNVPKQRTTTPSTTTPSTTTSVPARPTNKVTKVDNAEVRRWAVEQGYEVAAQGRLPRHIIEAYQEAGK